MKINPKVDENMLFAAVQLAAKHKKQDLIDQYCQVGQTIFDSNIVNRDLNKDLAVILTALNIKNHGLRGMVEG